MTGTNDTTKRLRHCDRCGLDWQPLGRVLKYGEFYPEREVMYADGTKKTIPSQQEIIEAICTTCAKEVWDNERIASLERKVAAGEALAEAVGRMEINEKQRKGAGKYDGITATRYVENLHFILQQTALNAYKEATKE